MSSAQAIVGILTRSEQVLQLQRRWLEFNRRGHAQIGGALAVRAVRLGGCGDHGRLVAPPVAGPGVLRLVRDG